MYTPPSLYFQHYWLIFKVPTGSRPRVPSLWVELHIAHAFTLMLDSLPSSIRLSGFYKLKLSQWTFLLSNKKEKWINLQTSTSILKTSSTLIYYFWATKLVWAKIMDIGYTWIMIYWQGKFFRQFSLFIG